MGTAVIYGTSVAALRAAANIGKLGHRVYIINEGRYLGDRPSQLLYRKPRTICNTCLRFVLKRMPHVEIIHNATITGYEKKNGGFRVKVHYREPDVDERKCIECDRCLETGLVRAYRRPMGGNVYLVDWDKVNDPSALEGVCPTGALNPRPAEKDLEIDAGAVLLSPDCTPEDDAALADFGYGKAPDVVKVTEIERWFSGTGPELEAFVRPSDGRVPDKVAYIVTPGLKGRDLSVGFEPFVNALENALSVKRLKEDIEITFFVRDLLLYGKGQWELLKKGLSKGIKIKRVDDIDVQGLEISWDGKSSEFDMIVLSPSSRPPERNRRVSEIFGLQLDERGYLVTKEDEPIETEIPGIFVLGEAAGHLTYIESLNDGAAAALRASRFLGEPEVKGQSLPPLLDIKDVDEPRTTVHLCKCALADLDVDEVARRIGEIDTVRSVKVSEFLCLEEGLKELRETATDGETSRIVLAACSPWKRGLFLQNKLRSFGFPISLTDIAEVRDMGVFPHAGEPAEAVVEKVIDLVKLSVEKIKFSLPYDQPLEGIVRRAIVIGNCVAAYKAALEITERGIEVLLLDPSGEDEVLASSSGKELLKALKKGIEEKGIKIYKPAEITSVDGFVGHYRVSFRADGEGHDVEVGAIVIAGAGRRELPSELKELSHPGMVPFDRYDGRTGEKGVTFFLPGVLSAGSRSTFTREGIGEVLLTAAELKESNREIPVRILYLDTPVFGKYADLEARARKAGVEFIPYWHEPGPSFAVNGETIKISYYDDRTGEKKELVTSILVPYPVIRPDISVSKRLSELLGLEIDEDGFFYYREDPYEEINAKLAPNDLGTNGIFLTGFAKAQKDLEGLIVDSEASAFEASVVLSKEKQPPQSGWVVSYTDFRKCAGCGFCVDACTYDARFIDPERKVSVVREILCQGCGACEAACPSGAAKLRVMNAKSLLSVVDKIT